MRRRDMAPFAASFLIGLVLLLGCGRTIGEQGKTEERMPKEGSAENDRLISAHAQRMIDEGRRTFRFDTFGSEAFWGESLQLHRAIAGEKNGGVGGGVSPN